MKARYHFLGAGVLGYLGVIAFMLQRLDFSMLPAVFVGSSVAREVAAMHQESHPFVFPWQSFAGLLLWALAGALAIRGCIRVAQSPHPERKPPQTTTGSSAPSRV